MKLVFVEAPIVVCVNTNHGAGITVSLPYFLPVIKYHKAY